MQLDRPGVSPDGTRPAIERLALVEMADKLYDWRRRRDIVFADCGSVFAEPCWDILLDLFSSQERGRRVALSSASIAARCPATTGIRHVQRLEKAGLVVREPDAQDGRRSWISLTPKANELLRSHLTELAFRERGGYS